jgi:hypothetical protein
MKNLILLFIFLVVAILTGRAQSNSSDTARKFMVVCHPEYYKEEGIIFRKDYTVGILMHDLQYRYTPTDKDTRRADKLFDEQFNQVEKANFNTKEYFYCWVRQYVGLVDKAGHKNIIVQLINNRRPRKVNKLLGKGWKKGFVIMLSDEFYAVSTRFRINIDTGIMTTEL